MSELTTQHKIRLLIGFTSTVVGVVATGLAIFRWTENSTTIYLLGDFARCVCIIGGFLAGINRLNDNQRFLETNSKQ